MPENILDDYWKEMYAKKKDVYTETVRAQEKELNGYMKFDPSDEALVQVSKKYAGSEDHELQGVPCAIKNNIAVEDNVLSCASALLKDFVSPITASAVRQLLEVGVRPVGLTNMDEFGMGSDTTNTIFGATKNPWDTERTAGGSSGGSASVVASGSVPFALGSDTGGSVRQPAAFCGQWGLKPTYGSVSRYGLVAYASSLDVIGVIAEHPKWLAPVFESMRVKGKDIKDASAYYPIGAGATGVSGGSALSGDTGSVSSLPSSYTKKIGIYIPQGHTDAVIIEAMALAKKQYESAGYEVELIDLPMIEYSPAVYLNISTAEASTNLARFDGVRYGDRGGYADSRLELIRNARNNGFGNEVKLRVITGGFVLRSGFQDQYYVKAQKFRAHIKAQMVKYFQQYDLIITPVTTTPAFKLGDSEMDPFQQKLADAYSVLANLAGIPAVSYPVLWKDGLPVGIQAMAPHYAEQRLFNFVNDTYDLFEYQQSPYARNVFEKTGRDISGGLK